MSLTLFHSFRSLLRPSHLVVFITFFCNFQWLPHVLFFTTVSAQLLGYDFIPPWPHHVDAMDPDLDALFGADEASTSTPVVHPALAAQVEQLLQGAWPTARKELLEGEADGKVLLL